MDWSKVTILEVEQAAKTMTAQQMGTYFCVSKNTIIGFCYLKKIPLLGRRKAVKEAPISPIRQHGALSVNFKKKFAKPKRKPPIPKELDVVKPLSTEWASVPNGCRFVIGEVKDLRGCNMPVGKESSWCETHRPMIYAKGTAWVRK